MCGERHTNNNHNRLTNWLKAFRKIEGKIDPYMCSLRFLFDVLLYECSGHNFSTDSKNFAGTCSFRFSVIIRVILLRLNQ